MLVASGSPWSMPVVEEKTCAVPALSRQTLGAGSEYQHAAADARVLLSCSSVRTSNASSTWSGRA
eukprot:8385602-Prorocentrum_lima.AAC.1